MKPAVVIYFLLSSTMLLACGQAEQPSDQTISRGADPPSSPAPSTSGNTPTEAPPSCTIAASHAQVASDELVTVAWSSQHTTSCRLQFDSMPLVNMPECSGSVQFAPGPNGIAGGEHLLAMHVEGPQGEDVCDTKLTVLAPNPLEIEPGQAIAQGPVRTLSGLCDAYSPYPAAVLRATFDSSGALHTSCTKHDSYSGLSYGKFSRSTGGEWSPLQIYEATNDRAHGDIRFLGIGHGSGIVMCVNQAGHASFLWRHHPNGEPQHLDYDYFDGNSFHTYDEYVPNAVDGWLSHPICAQLGSHARPHLIYRDQVYGPMVLNFEQNTQPIPHTGALDTYSAVDSQGQLHLAAMLPDGSLWYMSVTEQAAVLQGPETFLPQNLTPPPGTPYIYTPQRLVLDSDDLPHIITVGALWIPKENADGDYVLDWDFMHIKTIRHHWRDSVGNWNSEMLYETPDDEISALHSNGKGHHNRPLGVALTDGLLLVVHNDVGILRYTVKDLAAGTLTRGTIDDANIKTVGHTPHVFGPALQDSGPAAAGRDGTFVVVWQPANGGGLRAKTLWSMEL